MIRFLPALLVAVGFVLIATSIASAAPVDSVLAGEETSAVARSTAIAVVVTADGGATPILQCSKTKDGEGKSCTAKVVALSQVAESRPDAAQVPRILTNSPWREPVVTSVQPRPPKGG